MSQREGRTRHGRRLRALGDAFHRTVKYALRPLDWEQFAAQFPGLAEPLVADLYSGYKQLSFSVPALQALHHTRVSIETDFEELCEELGLRDKLATLETLCEEQGIADGDAADATRQPALGPTNAIRLGLLRAKQAEVESLRSVLAQCEERNAALQGQLASRRGEARELLAKAQPIAAQLDAVHASSKAWANRVVEPVG
ncbi:Embryo defective isoform 1 [Micractinium conductrix]|uniref:Embryo defective isoform 1 n=1 Tax=Micractinium conductrix TaxID=554055 RepID=A0A2P6VJV6_9CHLO|nr:Embryo defective isoform 1 [Micractinium conductrix]|eukprot:PSC74379.1 Embryo defective isoform 1 [Micractinium conductrix]